MLIAVPVNAALIVFTMNAFDNSITELSAQTGWPSSYFLMYKVLVCFLLQYALFMVISAINILVSSEVEEIATNADRTRAVISNLALMDLELARAQKKNTIELTNLRKEVAELRSRVT